MKQVKEKSGADCTGATSICQADEMALSSHAVRLAYDLEPQGGGAGQKRKAEAPVLLRQANVLSQKKSLFDFIGGRLFDPRSKALELDN